MGRKPFSEILVHASKKGPVLQRVSKCSYWYTAEFLLSFVKQYSILGVAEITVSKIIILFWCGYCVVCLSILLYFRRMYSLRPSASELAGGLEPIRNGRIF